MKMTLDQVARRATTRRNNYVARRWPLFADQFATTVDEQIQRIVRQRDNAERGARELRRTEAVNWRLGQARRAVAFEIVPDKARDAERLWQKFNPAATAEHDGTKLAAWWWHVLRGTGWAAEHCPNRERHSEAAWYAPRWHFLRGRFIEQTHCPTCGKKKNGA